MYYVLMYYVCIMCQHFYSPFMWMSLSWWLFTDGALSSFINYGMGILNPVITAEIYQKSVRGLSVEGCAQLCLDEKSFNCVSFDYTYEDDEKNICSLSQYISANVQGLVVDSTNPRHNHFERIGLSSTFLSMKIYHVKLFKSLHNPRECALLKCRIGWSGHMHACMSKDVFIETGLEWALFGTAIVP